MSDPTPYIVSYSFSGYQALNPNRPLPAGPVDVEFANIAVTLGETISALAEVRRSDGNLQNGVVTWDGLSADLQALISNSDDRVTVGDITPGAFASQVEAETGVANDKLMTPLRAKQQLDALRAFASQAQAQAGIVNTVVMSPLRTAEAITAQRPYSSQAEAEAGTENTKVATSLRVAQAIAALRNARTVSQSLTWGAIGAGASAEQTVTLTGALVNDRVVIGLPAAGIDAGLIAQAWISSSNNVRIRLTNITASPITPASGAAATYAFTALRF